MCIISEKIKLWTLKVLSIFQTVREMTLKHQYGNRIAIYR
jgi:hypothetical protein